MGKFYEIFIKRDKYYLIGILFLGFSSGSSFTLISFAIPYQLSEAKYTTDIIGAIFLTAMPYCLKPLWAPFIDRFSIPIFCSKFGQRRGWALAAQTCLLLSISCFLIIDTIDNLFITSIIAFCIAFFAATQDIVLDAYRIERPPTKEELSLAITFSGVGFRFGILLGSIAALHLSDIFNWNIVYLGAFVMAVIGPIVVLNIKEPTPLKKRQTTHNLLSIKEYFQVIKQSIFTLKKSHPKWILIIVFIFLYKASDSIPMAMSSPLFIDLSFSASEIASVSKAWGLFVMIIGGFIGGVVTSKIGVFRSILICGTIQLLAPLMFVYLSMSGHDIIVFFITTTIQNFCCGLGGTAIAIYLAHLCTGELVATQFALIASFSSFSRISLSSISGFCAKYVSWPQFFLGNALFSMLFILVFLRINKKRTF